MDDDGADRDLPAAAAFFASSRASNIYFSYTFNGIILDVSIKWIYRAHKGRKMPVQCLRHWKHRECGFGQNFSEEGMNEKFTVY